MRRIFILTSAVMLACLLAASAFAAEEAVRSIESFDFFIETASGMRGDEGGSLDKTLRQINDKIPDLGYPEAGMHTFSPENTILELKPYDRAVFSNGIDKLIKEWPGKGNTSLGKGFDNYGPMYSDMLRKGAVIVFTDGDYGDGRDSLNEAKIFYLTQPQMCLHFVSFASSEKAQKLIDEMAAINSCSVSVVAKELVDNEANTEDFVRRVFYDAVEIEDPIIDFVMLSIPFGFDSDKLDENTAKVAEALAERLKAQPEYYLKIEGYTCSIGPKEYNLDLSKRRAASVKNYIVNTGVEPSRIVTDGLGVENPRYDNGTREGRSLNRRVEFTFFLPDEAKKQ